MCLCEYVDDARIGEKGGMQINKAEVLSVVIYVQLWAQRFVLCFSLVTVLKFLNIYNQLHRIITV